MVIYDKDWMGLKKSDVYEIAVYILNNKEFLWNGWLLLLLHLHVSGICHKNLVLGLGI